MKRLKGFITNDEFIELAEELKYALAGISLKYDYIPNLSLSGTPTFLTTVYDKKLQEKAKLTSNSLKVDEKDVVIRFVNSTLNVDVNDIEIIDKRIKGNKSSEISFCQKYDNRPFIEYMELLASFVDIYRRYSLC